MFDRAKSEAIRRGLNLALNGRYGEIQSLRFHTREQSVDLELLLNGEAKAIVVNVGRYEFEGDEGEVVVLKNIRVSRTWMQELASDHLEGYRVEVPSRIRGIVKMVFGD